MVSARRRDVRCARRSRVGTLARPKFVHANVREVMVGAVMVAEEMVVVVVVMEMVVEKMEIVAEEMVVVLVVMMVVEQTEQVSVHVCARC